MIIRIPTTTAAIFTTATPTCSHHKSKSRAMQQQQHTNNNTTFIINTATTQLQQEQHQHQLPASYQPNATPASMRRAIRTKTTIASTMRRLSLAILQFLLLSCALPPPLQTLLPALLPFTLQQRSLAVEALPITSKPIESTAENLAWQAWLMLPPEQKQLEKSRKVTPKSIFSLPFRECPPGHQLFQSRCIPTVNINQSDLLTQQVLGLFVGSANDGGTTGAGGNADNAYEFDYGEEEYGLGMGEGEAVVMFETPQPYNGGAGGGGVGIAAAASGALNTQQQQVPHMRDEPLKFNLFEQKYPTSDYETDVSSGSGGVEGSGRPMTDYVPTGILAEEDAKVLNSTQFLAAVQGFMQTHNTANKTMNIPNINSTSTAQNTNRTTHEATVPSSKQQEQMQGLPDLHAASSNISAFAVDEIDAIILPAVSTSNVTTALEDAADRDAVVGSASDDLEPQRISLFKNDASVQLPVTTVTAQTDSTSRRTTVEDGMRKGDEAEDLVAEQSTLTQYLRADALLPLSSVAPFLTTTTIPNVLATTTPSEETNAETTKVPLILTKDERPRSVLPEHKQNETDAQELGFVTSTEAESTTNFQIDETTVVEVDEQAEEYAKVAGEQTSLLAAISQQQQLEAEKTKVEQVAVDVGGGEIITTTYALEASEATTIKINGNKLTATKINADETADRATTVVPTSFIEYEKSLDETTTQKITATTLQPLFSSVDTAPTTTTMNTIKTTTAYSISTTTPSTDRFRSAPAAVTTAIASSNLLAHKQVAAAVSPTMDTTSTRAQVADQLSGGKTAAISAVAEFSEAVANDMPRSGINDLVNVAASENNNDNNNKRNKSNRKTPIRIVVKKSAVRTNSEINIEQELRMINELVKGNRQLTALKMPAIKTTETTTTTTKLPTAAQTKLELTKSANATEHAENGSVDDLAAAEVEVWRDIAAPKETTKEVETTPMTTKERTKSKTTKETTTQIDTVTTTTQDTTRTQDTTAQTSNISAYTGGAASATKGAVHETTTNLQASAKMESGSSELAKAEADTSKKSKIAETARKIIELATKTSAAEPEFEHEFEDTTATNTEANEASFWTRIMPIFGFGGKAAVEVEEQEVEPTEAAVTIQQLAANTASDGSSISSNSSSSSGSSSNFSSDNSKSSLSDIHSTSANDNNNNNKNIVNNLNNNNNVDSPIRRNSKIIRIDHLSDNSVATAASTTNALEEAPATGTTITTATNTATTKTTTAHEHNANAEEPSDYWWLPAGWRLDRGTNEEQQPLLLRLWSAFPESHLKTKVST